MHVTAPRTSIVLALVVIAACIACTRGSDRSAPEGGGGAVTPDDDSACAPDRVGLAAARPVPMWRPPEGCTRANHAGQTFPVRSEEELRAQYTCPDGVPVAIDFSRDQLVLADGMLSPAQVGTDLYDDGTTITFVSRQRTNCPDDPRPMPTPFTVAFLLPAGAERVYAAASCTVRRGCP